VDYLRVMEKVCGAFFVETSKRGGTSVPHLVSTGKANMREGRCHAARAEIASHKEVVEGPSSHSTRHR
jgi:hypothetical protein